MGRLHQRMTERWSALGLAARLWWAALSTVGLAAVLVLGATATSDASSHPFSRTTTPSAGWSSGIGGMKSMAGMGRGGLSAGAPRSAGSARTAATVCANVKGATTMADGMVMAPVPSGSPTAAQQAAANQLVAQTRATLARYTSLTAATAAGYVPATNPDGYVVHYANWQIAKTDGFDPAQPAFLVYAETAHGPELLGAMYLGPAPCTPGPDAGGPLTQWHAHDNLCLSAGQLVDRTSDNGTCATGVHNADTYFMLHVWTEPSLARTHQFQPDLTRALLTPIIRGHA